MKPDDLTAEQIVLALGTHPRVGNVQSLLARYFEMRCVNARPGYALWRGFRLGTVAAESAGFVPLNGIQVQIQHESRALR